MIEGKSETIDEWYQILQQNYDKYELQIHELEHCGF